LKNAAVYYRVSTDRQDLNSQVVAVEAFISALPAEKKPAKLLIYKDEGISGKDDKRPGFQEMLRHAYTKLFDTIICYRLDRFSRKANTAIKQIIDLDEAGVAFISVTQPVLNLGHDNPFRRTMLAAFAEISELERDAIVARVRSGLDAARKKGVALGRPRIVTDEIQARVLELRAAGTSQRKIAELLGISLGSVANILKMKPAV
jgi:DNA invertase Pin-like site-specific DNA recombinase